METPDMSLEERLLNKMVDECLNPANFTKAPAYEPPPPDTEHVIYIPDSKTHAYTAVSITNLDVIKLFLKYNQNYFMDFLDDLFCTAYNNGSRDAAICLKNPNITDEEFEDKISEKTPLSLPVDWLYQDIDTQLFLIDTVKTILSEHPEGITPEMINRATSI